MVAWRLEVAFRRMLHWARSRLHTGRDGKTDKLRYSSLSYCHYHIRGFHGHDSSCHEERAMTTANITVYALKLYKEVYNKSPPRLTM